MIVSIRIQGIFEHIQSRLILCARIQLRIIRILLQKGFRGNQGLSDGRPVCFFIQIKELPQIFFTEVGGVVQIHILNHLESARVACVNQVLIGISIRLQTEINIHQIDRMETVVVIAGSVLHHGIQPDSREAQCLDVVQLFDQSLEIAAPCGVGIGVACHTVVPAVNIITAVAVVETGNEQCIDRFVAEVGSSTVENRKLGILVGTRTGIRVFAAYRTAGRNDLEQGLCAVKSNNNGGAILTNCNRCFFTAECGISLKIVLAVIPCAVCCNFKKVGSCSNIVVSFVVISVICKRKLIFFKCRIPRRAE